MASRSPALRRALVALPALVVVGAVGWLLARARDDGARERSEREIRARWAAPIESETLVEDVERHLAAHGADGETRWFVAEAFARLARFRRAHDVVWDDPVLSVDPRSPRRYATLLLEHLAEGHSTSNRLGARTAVVRAEADVPGGREALARLGADPVFAAAFRLFWESAAMGGATARRLVGEAMRRRPEPEFRIAAASLTVGPRDREGLEDLVQGLSHPSVLAELAGWRQVARAIGCSGEARGVAALRAAVRAAEGPEADIRRRAAEIGLALAEDPTALSSVRHRLERRAMDDADGALYAAGLGVRLAQGDATAASAVEALWPAAPGTVTRLTLALALLLGDDAPPEPLRPLAQRIEDELRASPEPLLQTISWAAQWRRFADQPAEAPAREALLQLVARAAEALSDPEIATPATDGFRGPSASLIEALRALARPPGS